MKWNKDTVHAFAMIGQIGLNMLVPIVLCVLFGRWLDRKLGTDFFLFIFIILGILTAYKSLFDSTKHLLKGDRERENEAYQRKIKDRDE